MASNTSIDFVKFPFVTIQAISNILSTSIFKPTVQEKQHHGMLFIGDAAMMFSLVHLDRTYAKVF